MSDLSELQEELKFLAAQVDTLRAVVREHDDALLTIGVLVAESVRDRVSDPALIDNVKEYVSRMRPALVCPKCKAKPPLWEPEAEPFAHCRACRWIDNELP